MPLNQVFNHFDGEKTECDYMENYVFKKDYSKDTDACSVDVAESDDIFSSPMIREYLKFHSAFMRKLPKIVVPKDQMTFERLVPKLDELAKKFTGTIEATVDYQQWDSHIIMTLPFFELARDEDRELFMDIAQNTHAFNITATENGNVRIYIMINYFQEIMPKDWDDLNDIADEVILDMEDED